LLSYGRVGGWLAVLRSGGSLWRSLHRWPVRRLRPTSALAGLKSPLEVAPTGHRFRPRSVRDQRFVWSSGVTWQPKV